MTEADDALLLPATPSIYVFVAAPDSGKSHAVRYLLYRMFQKSLFKDGIIITGSKCNGDFEGLLDDSRIWDGWDQQRFEDYHADLKDRTASVRAKSNHELPPNFIVFDDLMGILSGARVPDCFNHFISTHRHTNTWVFILTQSIENGVPTRLKNMTNFAFVCQQEDKDMCHAVYKAFGNRKFYDQSKALVSWKEDEFLQFWADAVAQQYYWLVMIKKKIHCDPDSHISRYRCWKAGMFPSFSFTFPLQQIAQLQHNRRHNNRTLQRDLCSSDIAVSDATEANDSDDDEEAEAENGDDEEERAEEGSCDEESDSASSQSNLKNLLKELDSFVGLTRLKAEAHELVQVMQYDQHQREAGCAVTSPPIHMVFQGEPGTGKTEVARLMSKILCAVGVVSRGQLHEMDAADLTGEYLGTTKKKVKKAFENARGGVLFLDEIYGLVS